MQRLIRYCPACSGRRAAIHYLKSANMHLLCDHHQIEARIDRARQRDEWKRGTA
jgi:hypothetical protein